MDTLLMIAVLMDADHTGRILFIHHTAAPLHVLDLFIAGVLVIQPGICFPGHKHPHTLLLQQCFHPVCNHQIQILLQGPVHTDLARVISSMPRIQNHKQFFFPLPCEVRRNLLHFPGKQKPCASQHQNRHERLPKALSIFKKTHKKPPHILIVVYVGIVSFSLIHVFQDHIPDRGLLQSQLPG